MSLPKSPTIYIHIVFKYRNYYTSKQHAAAINNNNNHNNVYLKNTFECVYLVFVVFGHV